MRTFLVLLMLLCCPAASQASVFGFVFGTDDPGYRQYRSQRSAEKHERELQSKQMKHERDMTKRHMEHERKVAKYGYRPSSVTVRSYSKPAVVRYYSLPAKPTSVRHGTVVIHF